MFVSELLLTMMLVVFLPVVILTSAGTLARFSLRRANRVGPGRSASDGTNTLAVEPGRRGDAAPPAAFSLPAGRLGRELAPRAAPAALAQERRSARRATPSSTWPGRSSRRQSSWTINWLRPVGWGAGSRRPRRSLPSATR